MSDNLPNLLLSYENSGLALIGVKAVEVRCRSRKLNQEKLCLTLVSGYFPFPAFLLWYFHRFMSHTVSVQPISSDISIPSMLRWITSIFLFNLCRAIVFLILLCKTWCCSRDHFHLSNENKSQTSFINSDQLVVVDVPVK